jgi:hypothetical protein
MSDLLESGSGKDILPSTSNFPAHCHSTMPCTHLLLGVGTVDPLDTTVQKYSDAPPLQVNFMLFTLCTDNDQFTTIHLLLNSCKLFYK